jgi:hypothetical protein
MRWASGRTVVVFVALLIGCASPAPDRPVDITYAHLPPIAVDVRTIEVISAYANVATAPHVETRLATPPNEVMLRWGRERLRAQGVSGSARFTVQNAPLTEEPLPKQRGFLGAFTIEPGDRYTLTVDGQLEVLDDSGQRLAIASARVTQTGTLKEGATPEERQAFWLRLTRLAMDAFNAQMESAIRQHLQAWVR